MNLRVMLKVKLEKNSRYSLNSCQLLQETTKVIPDMLTYLETIKIIVNNEEIMTDSDGNFLQTKIMEKEVAFFLSVISEDEKAAASAQSSTGLFTMLLTFGTSTFISVALGGTVEATWLLFGCIQLMSLVPLFNLNLPGNFREFSKNLAVLHGEPGALPNLFSSIVDTSDLKPYNPYYELMSNFYIFTF